MRGYLPLLDQTNPPGELLGLEEWGPLAQLEQEPGGWHRHNDPGLPDHRSHSQVLVTLTGS